MRTRHPACRHISDLIQFSLVQVDKESRKEEKEKNVSNKIESNDFLSFFFFLAFYCVCVCVCLTLNERGGFGRERGAKVVSGSPDDFSLSLSLSRMQTQTERTDLDTAEGGALYGTIIVGGRDSITRGIVLPSAHRK